MVDLRPGLVLLDVQLPDIDGLMIADDLARATREPLVVLISARGSCDYDATRLTLSPTRRFSPKTDLSGNALVGVLAATAGR